MISTPESSSSPSHGRARPCFVSFWTHVWSPDELRIGDLAAALFYSIEGLAELPGRESSQSPDLATSREALDRTRQILQELIGSYCERTGKKIWCEKSPANLLHLASGSISLRSVACSPCCP
jgi:hypothetical protein